MQKKIKWGLILVLLGLLLLGSISCKSLGSGNVAAPQLVKVVRGDVTANVSGSGSIEVAKEAKLVFGVGGRIEKIYVKEGDEVTKGQVLARLETDTLEMALSQAEMSQTRAEVAVAQAEIAVNQAQLAITQAKINVEKAKIAQYQATVFQWPEVAVAQADVDKAKYYSQYAGKRLADAPDTEKAYWSRLVLMAEEDFARAEDKLNVLLYGTPTEETVIKRQEEEAAKQSLELAKQSVAPAQQAVKLAEQSLKQAQKQLDEATLTAPFAGLVADVSAEERDTIPPPGVVAKTIIYLVDPASMELKVRIDEIDIAGVNPGQKAIIKVDALTALQIVGKVSYIGFVPTGETGVVGYDVKISFAVPKGAGLRSGMSASADIINAEGKDVLLIPDRTIKRGSQGQATVEVMVNGKIELRAIVTGISDGLQTEIVEGLREGETVLEKRAGSNSADSAGSLFGG